MSDAHGGRLGRGLGSPRAEFVPQVHGPARKPPGRERCGGVSASGSRNRVSDADCPRLRKPPARDIASSSCHRMSAAGCGWLVWRREAAGAPSPDVRGGHPARRSLGCRRRFAIVAPLGVIRRLPGHGQPLAEFDLQALSCLPWPVAPVARSVNRVCTGSSACVTSGGPVPSIRSALRLPVVRQDPGHSHARQRPDGSRSCRQRDQRRDR